MHGLPPFFQAPGASGSDQHGILMRHTRTEAHCQKSYLADSLRLYDHLEISQCSSDKELIVRWRLCIYHHGFGGRIYPPGLSHTPLQ